MKKRLIYHFAVAVTLASTLSSCASYSASSLRNLSSEINHSHRFSGKEGNVTVVAKTFDKKDCEQYLDRDILAKGYQPVQLYIQNDSDNSYSFSLNRVSITCSRADEVAEKVHTSTVGRAVGYGAAAVLTCGLFVIPAIIDGVKSSEAIEALDNDFLQKTAKDQSIAPHSCLNKLLFVPIHEYQSDFNVTLINCESNKPEIFKVFTG